MVDGGHNLQSFLAGVGSAAPKQAPSWFASQEQYETFQKLVAMDVGSQCITATGIGVAHLDEDSRKQI